MFKCIVVALKFTPASKSALRTACRIARIQGSELHIFHALDYNLTNRQEDDEQLVALKKRIQLRFEEEIRPIVQDLESVSFHSLPCDPALEVCRIAGHCNADLIVLGSHQLPEKMCLGRIDYTGMTILEKAPCPVLMVPLCE